MRIECAASVNVAVKVSVCVWMRVCVCVSRKECKSSAGYASRTIQKLNIPNAFII